MNDETILKVSAIFGIVLIESVALFLGVNGVLLSVAVAGIAGIAGYEIGIKRTHE